MEGKPRAPAIEWQGLVNWGQEFFGPSGTPGGADIVCAGPALLSERAGELLFVVLTGLMDGDGKPVYRDVLVVLPPTEDEQRDAIIEQVAAATRRIRGTPPDVAELAIIRRRVTIRRASNFDSESLLDALQDLSVRTLVLVIESAGYRKEDLDPVAQPVGTARIDEDLWVQHLHAVAASCVQIARSSDSCIILDAGEWLPVREVSQGLLRSIDGCGVFGGNHAHDPSEAVLAEAEGWLGHVKIGRTDLALAAIDALPSSLDSHKVAFKIQTLQMGGNDGAAIQLLRSEMAAGNRFDPRFRVRAAHIADAANEHAMAAELLRDTVHSLAKEEWIEQALVISRRSAVLDVEKECIDRLETLFPRSIGLRDHYFVQLLKACGDLANGREHGELGGSPRFAAFSSALLGVLQNFTEETYAEATATTEKDWPEYAAQGRLGCAVHAQESNRISSALVLARPQENSGDFARHAAGILLWAIETSLLAGEKVRPLRETLTEAVVAVLAYLAKHPTDVSSRARLTRLMSVQVSATLGIALLAYAVLTLSTAEPNTKQHGRSAKGDSTSEQFQAFYRAALDTLKDKGPLQIGLSQLPADLMVPSADALLAWVVEMIDGIGRGSSDPEDFVFLETLLAVGAAIAPHTDDPNQDLFLLRVAAEKLAVAGRMQKARDHVEHALTITRGNPLRARLAWYGFADIYQRGRNPIEALVGIGCTLSCATEINADQAFYETYGLIRILRDLGMGKLAWQLLPRCAMLMDQLELRGSMSHRLETIELGLRISEAASTRDPDALRGLAADLVRNLETVIGREDEILPVAVMTAQVFQMCKDVGVTVDDVHQALLDQAAASLEGASAQLMGIAADPEPSSYQVLEWLKRTEAARYSEDVGYDMQVLVRTARRLLSTAEAVNDARVALFASELTTDLGVTPPGPPQADGERPVWLPSSIEVTGERAVAVSLRGITVCSLALDQHDRLVRITAEGGVMQPTVVEDESVFSTRRLSEWSKTYPFAYGFDSDDPNLFYTSTRGLGLTQSASGRVVFVLDTELQRLSPNLIVIEDELAGRNAAVAVAPSMTWLHAAVTGSQTVQLQPAVAWISTATEGGLYGTLEMLADRLRDPLERHGIKLLTAPDVPSDLQGAELAIVAAHGGVASEGRYFQVVADEDGLRMSAVTLSRALAGAGVVVLFVCSGGRFDKHPIASTAVALPKELLDRGCSAVVGSPWPLEAGVPAHWLPAFLDAWDAGVHLVDAVLQANRAVALHLGDSPARSLAMTVYGNPLVVRRAPIV
jgi:hypothetical protein